MQLIEYSQNLLASAKLKVDSSELNNRIANFPIEDLYTTLNSDETKKAFWINLYNAQAIILLRPKPDVILSSFKRKWFFNRKQITVAGISLSLNDIEHHILRKSQVWWGKGYLKKRFPSRLEKELRVIHLDPRIHFALNCGGMSCPPIRYYEPEQIDLQLDMATKAFLFSEASHNSKNNTVNLSRIFDWYKGDFGGNEGILSFLRKYQVITPTEQPQIVYSNYNWTPWINKTTS